MTHSSPYRLIKCIAFLLALSLPVEAGTITLTTNHPNSPLEGQILYTPIRSHTTYLIDRSGNINHTWESDYNPGEGVRWLGDGTILRTESFSFGIWGSGGGVQKILYDGTVVWDFHYASDTHLSHHDVYPLPNGNVFMIAWELKSRDEAIENGRDPNLLLGNEIWPSHIIEVTPTGPTTGDIVWEWHVWDHLIQDYDNHQLNYGDVSSHPELVDINYGGTTADWLHTNSITYNPAFDQIMISVHNFNEIWIIDHSTTTQEAAGHSGGRYGKGGDLLYRWGNPQSYDRGTSNDQVFFGQHDPSWIPDGCPGAGHILVFNNGQTRYYSSVDEFVPPVNATGYYLSGSGPYEPTDLTWSYVANPPSSFYSFYIGGAQRLPDGNTLICDGNTGRFFEVTMQGDKVWEWQNPYPEGSIKDVFKIVYIPPMEQPRMPVLYATGSLVWTKVPPGQSRTGSFILRNIGNPGSSLNWTVNTSLLTWGSWTVIPEDGTNLTPEDGNITVMVSVLCPPEENQAFEGYLRVENLQNASNYIEIPVSISTSLNQGISQQQYSSPFYRLPLVRLLVKEVFQHQI